MKLDRVTLENFGIYNRRTFEFGGAPLVLLYGPNESGKTTALNGLRQALLGFRPRTSYLTSRAMSAEVVGMLESGDLLEYTRKKGRQDAISGSCANRKVDAAQLLELLGGLDLTSYEQLFGFSLEELRKGEEALKSARLSEALAGGGLGGMSALQGLRNHLATAMGELYKSRGTTSSINQKLTQIQESKKILSNAQTLPSEVEDLQRQLAEMRGRSEALRDEQVIAMQGLTAAKRLRDGLPRYLRRAALERQLQSMDLPEGLDAAFVGQWGEHVESRKAIAARLEQETTQLRQEQQQLASLDGSGHLSEFEDRIERLGHQTDEISALRQRQAELGEAIQEAKSVSKRLCASLELDQVPEELREYSISMAQRRDLEKHSSEYISLSERCIAITAKLEAARQSLTLIESSDEQAAAPINLDELRLRVNDLLQAEKTAEDLASQLEVLQHDESRPAQERNLKRVVEVRELDVEWVLPSRQQVQEVIRNLHERRRETAAAVRDSQALVEQIETLESALDREKQEDSHDWLAKLQRNSAARDEILNQWVDDLTEPLIAASLTPAVQLERVNRLQELAAQADTIQQGVIASADAIAARNQQLVELERLRQASGKSQERVEGKQREEADCCTTWSQLWGALPFEPQPIEEIVQWVQEFETWRVETLRCNTLRRDLHIARGVVRSIRAQLLDCWPTSLRDDVPGELLAQRISAWENVLRDQQRDQQRLQAAQLAVATLTAELETVTLRRSEIESHYRTWMSSVPFTVNWPIEHVEKWLDGIDRLRREDETVRKTVAQFERVVHQLETYDCQVKQLCQELEHPLPTERLELVARKWFDAVQAMRSQRTQRIRLSASIEHRSGLVKELQQQLQAIDERLSALCTISAAGDMNSMATLVEQVRQAEILKAECAELSAALTATCRLEEVDSFLEQLATADEVQLQMAVTEFEQQLEQLEHQRKETDQTIGSLTERIEQLANNQAAQRGLQQLHQQRGELADMCEQWVVHRLASELLDRSIERFATEHEPALLQYSRDFLSELTGGRYRTIDHDPAQPTSFVVRNAQEESFTPDKLSTGTREQLYLAIRMAFISHYCEHHEALPVVMDDCFVNFDDNRTRMALQSIADWDIDAQRIILSCHWRVVQSLAEIVPDAPCIHLARDERLTVGELAGQSFSSV